MSNIKLSAKTSKRTVECIFLIIPLLVGCVSAAKSEWGEHNDEANPVSMIEVIARGEQYDGWKVQVSGVIHYDTENSLIFFSKDSYDNFDTTNSILIDIENDVDNLAVSEDTLTRMNGEFILVEGDYEHVGREKKEAGVYTFGPNYIGIIKNVNFLAAQ